MKKYLFSTMFLMLIFALFPGYVNAQSISELLPLDGLNFFVNTDNGTEGCTVSYDPNTQTITYDYPAGVSSYGWAGWDFREGKLLDLSAFSSLVLHLAETNIEPAGSIEFAVKYASFPGDSKFEKQNVGVDANVTITIPLDASAKNEVEYVYIKSANAGALRIEEITASMDGQMDLSFDDFHKDWKGPQTSYEYNSDLGLYIINFSGYSSGDNWQPWGWGNEGRNFAGYDYVRIDFAETYDYDITLEINYNPENGFPSSIATWPAGSTFIAVGINHNVPGEYLRPDNGELGGGIRDIVIRSEANEPSILLLDRAYVATGEVPVPGTEMEAPDLVVTNITWEPAILSEGAELLFTATVKNIGNKATPDNIKHGVVFRVCDVDEKVIFDNWSDDHLSSIAPGDSVFCKPTGSWGSSKTWTYFSGGGPYFVKAEVNDSNEFTELDRSNNFSEYFLIEDLETGISSVSVQSGGVSVENGVLKLTGYSSSASVTIYNIQGQSVKNDFLKTGAYIVKVLDNGHLSVHKILAK